MKNLTFLGVLSGISLLSFMGCSDESSFKDVDGLDPVIQLNTSNIKTEAGRSFTIKGTISDNDGIKWIRLKNEALQLDKVIDIFAIYQETIYNYELNYSFKTPASLEGDNFVINVTVGDLGGRTVSADVLVTMDGDFTAPVFTTSPDNNITVLIKNETKLNLRFSVTDDKALDKVEISIPALDYSHNIEADGISVDYSEVLILPSEIATYDLVITATDKAELTTTKNCKISVSEMPDFEKMYLADVSDASLLNSDAFGIPSLIDHTGPYTYRARYYSEVANSKVRFIPQKTDFSPICFGVDPENNSLLTDDPEISESIILPEAGKYYEITFNALTGEYSFSTYIPDDEPVKIGEPMYLNGPDSETIPLQIGLCGNGFDGFGSWNPGDIPILNQDADNPYLFWYEFTVTEAPKVYNFMIQTKHSWGWWPEPFWRWDDSENPEKNIFNGGENPGETGSAFEIRSNGKYMFKFDSHLLRSKLYPIN